MVSALVLQKGVKNNAKKKTSFQKIFDRNLNDRTFDNPYTGRKK